MPRICEIVKTKDSLLRPTVLNKTNKDWVQRYMSIIMIKSGYGHTIIVKPDGTLWGVGSNSNGQFGLGDTNNRSIFTQLSTAFNNPKMISCGYGHTVIVKSDGTVWVTGRNDYGQLGLGNTYWKSTFVQLPVSFNNPQMVICGHWHTVIVKSDGTVWGAGRGSSLGLGNTTNRTSFTQLSTAFNNPKIIACGGEHTVIVKSDGTVWATGDNNFGQLGLGDTTNRTSFTQLPTAFNNPKMVVCGRTYAFIVKSDGTVWVTGRNDLGQLGLGNTTNRSSFTQLSSTVNNPKMIVCGEDHTFLVKQDGTVWATGYNNYGQLGLGDTTYRKSFTQLSTAFNNPKMISCGGFYTFIIKSDGTVWSIGSNMYGQLGLGDTTDRLSFTQVNI